MKVIDKVKVIGRGYVLVVIPDDVIHITDKIIHKNVHYKITGIERVSHMKHIGLVLRPNDSVGVFIKIGDELTVLKNEDKV